MLCSPIYRHPDKKAGFFQIFTNPVLNTALWAFKTDIKRKNLTIVDMVLVVWQFLQ